tara:strand:- start:591 stop:1133 length:543 start_codon:yes stop_codon:yes gene_type:complete
MKMNEKIKKRLENEDFAMAVMSGAIACSSTFGGTMDLFPDSGECKPSDVLSAICRKYKSAFGETIDLLEFDIDVKDIGWNNHTSDWVETVTLIDDPKSDEKMLSDLYWNLFEIETETICGTSCWGNFLVKMFPMKSVLNVEEWFKLTFDEALDLADSWEKREVAITGLFKRNVDAWGFIF